MYFDDVREYLDVDDNTLAKLIFKVRKAVKKTEQDLARAEREYESTGDALTQEDVFDNQIWLRYTRPQLQELEEEFKNRQRARRG